MEIGKYDVFERRYVAEFRKIVSEFGEIINYEKDRAARDIGVHFTKKSKSENEYLSNSLVWFQLKGLTNGKLTTDKYNKMNNVDISLKVDQLKYWYIQSTITYLIVYIECGNQFLFLNIKKYLNTNYGNKILSMNQKYLTISIPKKNIFDEEVIDLMIREGDINLLISAFAINREEAKFGLRDYDIIYRIGTATKRNVEIRMYIRDWQTKTRNEIYFQEKSQEDDWVSVHQHWQFLLLSEEIEGEFPYLEFKNYSEDDFYFDDEPIIELSNGERIIGEEHGSELIEYYLSVSLNEIGEKLFNLIEIMIYNKFFDFDINKEYAISVAPWHYKDI